MPGSRVITLVLSASMFLFGCSGSNRACTATGLDEASLTASQRLAALAAIEAASTISHAGDSSRGAQYRSSEAIPATYPIGPPPGIDPGSVTPRADLDSRFTLDLSEALVELVPPVETSKALEQVDPRTRNEALTSYLRGREAAMEGRPQGAIGELEQARALDPTSTEILRELSRNYAAIGNGAAAAALHQMILQLDPEHPEALFTVGHTTASKGDYRGAVAHLGRLRTKGSGYRYDPAAGLLADYTLYTALVALGYDRAAIEAAHASLEALGELNLPSFYGQRVGSLKAERGEVWRGVGDAFCRLGEYDSALNAYASAASYSGVKGSALHARVVYVNLALGRPISAQHELFAAISAAAPEVDERDIRLCVYLEKSAEDTSPLLAAVEELRAAHPWSSGLVRAAASLAETDSAVELLGQIIEARPREVPAVGDLFFRFGETDLSAAVDLAASLASEHSDLASEYIDRLVIALPDPLSATLPESGSGFKSVAHAHLRGYLLLKLEALGEAWRVCREGLESWPDDEELLSLQVVIAGRLDDPTLLAEVIEQAGEPGDSQAWLLRAEAFRATDQLEKAVQAAAAAADMAVDSEERIGAYLETAKAYAELGAKAVLGEEHRRTYRHAAGAAEAVLDLDPKREEPYQMLLQLYGAGGPLAEQSRHAAVVGRLRREMQGSRFIARIQLAEAAQSGRLNLALESALDLYNGDPTDVESLTAAVLAWHRLGRAGDAEAWLRDLFEARPGDPALLEQLTMLLLRDGRGEEAVELLRDRLDSVDEDPVAEVLLRRVLLATGRSDEAVAIGERRLKKRPQSARRELELALLYARAGMAEEAMSGIDWIIAHADKSSYRHLTGAIGFCGQLRSLGDRPEEATVRLVEILAEGDERVPVAIYGLGFRSLVRLGQVGGRFDALAERAARLSAGAEAGSPQAAAQWQAPAQGLVDAGDPAAAARILRARLNSGYELESSAKALLASMTLIADAASGSGANRTIALLQSLEEDGLLGAIPGLAGAASLSEAMTEAGGLYTFVGDDDGAGALSLEAIRLNPDAGMAMNNLGYHRIEQGMDDAETIGWIERAGELSPDNSSVIDTVAWLRYKRGRFEDQGQKTGALDLLRRAVDLSEGGPPAELLDHLGDTLWRLGRADEAVEAWRQGEMLLNDAALRSRIVQAYGVQQSRVWGLLVSDPQALYDRDYGDLRDRIILKLAAVDVGDDPPVARTFEEIKAADVR